MILLLSSVISLLIAWIIVRAIYLYPIRIIVYGAFAKANYEGALHDLDRMKQRVPLLVNDETFNCFILSYAARPVEAEQICRQMLTEAPYLALNDLFAATFNLGASLYAQKRYEEALPLFEMAITAFPDDYRFYRGLIDYYLLPGKSTEHALALSELMMYFYRRPRFYTLALTRIDNVVTRCGRALALAHTGQIEKAERVLSLADKEAPHFFQPVMALLNVTRGTVYQIKGDSAAATAAFTETIKLDPNGMSGKMAAEQLNSGNSALKN